MLRVKRTKQGPPTVKIENEKRVEVPGPTATHYAAAVSSRGTIDAWSSDPDKAVAITDGAARRVREYYAAKKNVGVLAFEPVNVSAAMLADAVSAEDAVGAAEFAALQAECKRLQGRVNGLLADLEAAEHKANAAVADSVRAADKAHGLEEQMIAAGIRNAELAARVAELEAQQAEAQKAAANAAAAVAKKK